MKFIFDLDGTLTECETLPKIAEHFHVKEEISHLTAETIKGNIPFMESFIRRVDILGQLNVEEIAQFLAHMPINKNLYEFIQENKTNCIIATGNYRGWVESLAYQFNCELYCSEGSIGNDGQVKLSKILRKEEIVKKYQAQGETVVFIGDGNNDAEAMRVADISIACGIVHTPAISVLQEADYAAYDSTALVRLLNQLKTPQIGTSIVISAAGIGSRLGLGQTKSLITIDGKPLIQLQLNAFKLQEDVRIVVGFQAKDLIEEVLKTRRDIIFVYNHDYFHSKTGASLYLGARHAYDTIVAWDGDLLVHPDDINSCLEGSDEYIGVSSSTSEDSVYVKTDENYVLSFSREEGSYEWSGPARLKRNNIFFTNDHVYTMIEPRLPLPHKVIRAQDIDTYEDYKKAIQFVESWSGNYKIHGYYNALSKKITNAIETRNKAPDFSSYDIDLVKSYSNQDFDLLDIGSGTGLLINGLIGSFKTITAVEKYPEFSKFIPTNDNLMVINQDILEFEINRQFDIITIFGVMNFFNLREATSIYTKVFSWLKNGGRLIVKHQMGVEADVIVNGFSEELGTDYYSEYRSFKKEQEILHSIGFKIRNIIDIYPEQYNRWSNTHFYALDCQK